MTRKSRAATAPGAFPPKHRASATFRFYEELNDFLAPNLRKRTFDHDFDGTPSVKDRIEALGVPHTEVDLILVDGKSIGFGHRLHGGERVAVYPVFESFEIGEVTRLRPAPLREPRFILDVHLGRLAAYLRLLGFDSLYRDHIDDETIIEIAVNERRIVLTRDTGLLKNGRVTHGAFIHATRPLKQVREVVGRFQLDSRIRPFSRCMKCNGTLESVATGKIRPGEVPDDVRTRFRSLKRCRHCRRFYWKGGHFERMRRRLDAIGIRLPDV